MDFTIRKAITNLTVQNFHNALMQSIQHGKHSGQKGTNPSHIAMHRSVR
jgi:hypothetical protein